MKAPLLLIAIIFVTTLTATHSQVTVNDSFIYGGETRTYSFYVPSGYSSTQSVPLLLNLHGYTSNGS